MPPKAQEQAVIVRAKINVVPSDDVFGGLTGLEKELVHVVAAHHEGEYDGNEIGAGELTLYLYGADAERLYVAIMAVLQRHRLTRGAAVTLRFGPPGSPSRQLRVQE